MSNRKSHQLREEQARLLQDPEHQRQRAEQKHHLSLLHEPNIASVRHAAAKKLGAHVSAIVDIITQLRSPPGDWFSENGKVVTYKFDWAVKVVGEQNFEYDFRHPRKVLVKGSALRSEGLTAGLPLEILRWLCGEPGTEELVLPVERIDSEDSEDWR